MLEWLIIGGGIHGTAISFHLQRHWPAEQIRILDPHECPLAQWEHYTANTGMRFLRSPHVHHLHTDPWALRTFAATRRGEPLAEFIPLYDRPALALFHAFHAWMLDYYKLPALRLTGWAERFIKLPNGWRVETSHGDLTARRVVLALGMTELRRPDWAIPSARIHHLFDPDFQLSAIAPQETIAVIGGGISAAQAAVHLANHAPGRITLLSRHPMRMGHFSSDPCWNTPQCLRAFWAEPDFTRRRAILQHAQQPGTIPPEILEATHRAIAAAALTHRLGTVTAATDHTGQVTLELADGASLTVDRVLLATGFRGGRPGGKLVDTAIADYNLPLAACDFPLIDRQLCWHDGLYVTGALAELELGPAARNIMGARLAGERLRTVPSD